MLTRRNFLSGAAAIAAAASGVSKPALAQAKPKVVIVGGGAGGASVVRRLAAEAKGALDITLVEPDKTYTTCFYSNLYLGGFQTLETLQHGFGAIAKLPGVTVAHDLAKTVDRDKRQIMLAGGAALAYDRLVLSPGIALDYNSVPGWSQAAEERMPHGWKAGPQTVLLKRQLDAVPDGGTIVVIAPPNPYRCPPGPYERVSVMAHVLKTTGRTKAHIIILDPKDKFSKQGLFEQGWEKYYPGMIEWLPPTIHGGVKHVDPAAMTVETDFETYNGAALVNVIPRQTAGRIAIDAGLTAEVGFCPIDAFTMKSQKDGNIFVLGDAAIAGDMPKSAFSANSQAQAVALVIARELLGTKAPEIVYSNRCWSLIAADDSVFVGGTYRPTPAKIEQTENFISGLTDTAAQRRTNYEDSASWYANLTSALYG
jgi:NADPH-dependent 2,4-dienoyl-CoA reductase/sulfur reductase-like enzyme